MAASRITAFVSSKDKGIAFLGQTPANVGQTPPNAKGIG